MLRYQWEDADRERVGVSSRQKQKFTHTARSRSFASIADAEITHRKKDGSPMTFEAGEIMEKLKEKKAEYEEIASTDSSVNLENIDNRIITEVLGPELRDQITQMQVNMVEKIVEVQRKYEELQQQVRAEAVERETAERETAVAAMAVEQNRKYDELQLQLQQMMQMLQQSQKPPS
ncbi:hypothetical protein GOBAR_AA07463 [Gossypium barbadense]|uniref:Uncharacterized protein n=1 Tax=Gossypium barbadense TaxID=3634 RepID=A0A2P5YC53_GOSBA|nr:hypothetical protein GOBAR_AA07463 [Gossypium barbadense]